MKYISFGTSLDSSRFRVRFSLSWKFGSRIALGRYMSFASGGQARELNSPKEGSYPIGTHVEYRLMQRDRVLATGTGRTKTISSSRVVFESERGLPLGMLVELAVTWPVQVENGVGLTLQILGRTVHVMDKCTVVDILRHEFRTQAPQNSSEGPDGQSSPPNDRSSTACAS